MACSQPALTIPNVDVILKKFPTVFVLPFWNLTGTVCVKQQNCAEFPLRHFAVSWEQCPLN
jgi:hypothetical protein